MTKEALFDKGSVDALGIFGGTPLFPAPLHVGKPNLPPYARFAERMARVFERGWLSNHGPEVCEFERAIARAAGCEHCVAVCNATIGLEVAIRALGLSGEVIVPSFTFVATAHALAWQGLRPIFCDVDPDTHTIDASQIEGLITPRTTGIIGVHTWGRACDVEAIEAIARRHSLRVLLDAAHAFGCTHRGRPIGSFGDAEVFSFHATKFLNAFEGGAVVTNDGRLADAVRSTTNFGFADYDQVMSVGTNGKMTEAAAAMGLASLESMADIIAANRRNHQRYAAALRGATGIRMLTFEETEASNFQYVVLEIDPAAGLDRDRLVEVLHSENVLARRYFYPGVHRMEPYRTTQPDAGRGLPRTEALVQRVLVLPTGTAVDGHTIDQIVELVKFCIGNGAEIVERLPRERLSIARDLR